MSSQVGSRKDEKKSPRGDAKSDERVDQIKHSPLGGSNKGGEEFNTAVFRPEHFENSRPGLRPGFRGMPNMHQVGPAGIPNMPPMGRPPFPEEDHFRNGGFPRRDGPAIPVGWANLQRLAENSACREITFPTGEGLGMNSRQVFAIKRVQDQRQSGFGKQGNPQSVWQSYLNLSDTPKPEYRYLRCPLCPQILIFSKIETYIAHIATHLHEGDDVPADVDSLVCSIECPLCDSPVPNVFTTLGAYKEHLINHHGYS